MAQIAKTGNAETDKKTEDKLQSLGYDVKSDDKNITVKKEEKSK